MTINDDMDRAATSYMKYKIKSQHFKVSISAQFLVRCCINVQGVSFGKAHHLKLSNLIQLE